MSAANPGLFSYAASRLSIRIENLPHYFLHFLDFERFREITALVVVEEGAGFDAYDVPGNKYNPVSQMGMICLDPFKQVFSAHLRHLVVGDN